MENLKALFLALLLSLVACWQPYAESYYITEEQLTELENISKTQKEQLETQKVQIKTLQQELNEASKSLQTSENKNFQNKLLIGSVCFFAGFITGMTTGLLLKNK